MDFNTPLAQQVDSLERANKNLEDLLSQQAKALIEHKLTIERLSEEKEELRVRSQSYCDHSALQWTIIERNSLIELLRAEKLELEGQLDACHKMLSSPLPSEDRCEASQPEPDNAYLREAALKLAMEHHGRYPDVSLDSNVVRTAKLFETYLSIPTQKDNS